MLQTRQIGRHTEIYSDKNGGSESEIYITQNKATVFHDFWTRKILGTSETIDDFREVTEAERTQLQQIRDAWTRPPQAFIDHWNAACGKFGRYNEETGYFELNGLTDITYAEALRIMAEGTFDTLWNGGKQFTQRTHLPITAVWSSGTIEQSFKSNDFLFDVEVCNLEGLNTPYNSFAAYPISIYRQPFASSKLRTILGVIDFHFATMQINWFAKAKNLKTVNISRLSYDINLSGCRSLTYYSFLYMLENARMESRQKPTIVITVHATVYAKLTGDTTDADVAAMTAEEREKWMSLIPLAAEKNITFVAA